MTGTADDGITPVTEITANLIGTVLDGRYEILSVSGSSQDAVVFKARHQLMKRVVSIKMMRSSLESDPAKLEQFQQEARAQCSTGGAGGTGVFDFGVTEHGRPYLVMECSDQPEKGLKAPDKTKRKSARLWAMLILVVAAESGIWVFLRSDLGQLELTKIVLLLQDLKITANNLDHTALLTKAGDLSVKAGKFADAVVFYGQASDAVYGKSGADSIEYLEALAAVVSVEKHLPGYIYAAEDKKKLHRCQLQLMRRSQGLMSAGQGKESLALSERIYQAAVKAVGPNERMVDEALIDLANGQLDMQKWQEAESSYSQALKLASQSDGHFQKGAALRGLTFSNLYLKKYKEAKSYGENLLAIESSKPERFCLTMPEDYNGLATAYESLGDFGKAEACFKDALKLCDEYLEPASPETFRAVDHYRDFLVASGKMTEAMALIEERMRLVSSAAGSDSLAMKRLNVDLSVIEIQEGDIKHDKHLWQDALQHANRAMSIAKKLGDPVVAIEPITYIAESERRLGHIAEAEAAYEKLISMKDKLPAANLYQVCNAWRGMSDLSYLKGNLNEAVGYARKAVSTFESLESQPWQSKMQCLNALARLAHEQANRLHNRAEYEEAERCYQEELTLLDQHGGTDNPVGGNIKTWLGEVRRQLK